MNNEYYILSDLLDSKPTETLYKKNNKAVVWSELDFGAYYVNGKVLEFFFLRAEAKDKIKELKNV